MRTIAKATRKAKTEEKSAWRNQIEQVSLPGIGDEMPSEAKSKSGWNENLETLKVLLAERDHVPAYTAGAIFIERGISLLAPWLDGQGSIPGRRLEDGRTGFAQNGKIIAIWDRECDLVEFMHGHLVSVETVAKSGSVYFRLYRAMDRFYSRKEFDIENPFSFCEREAEREAGPDLPTEPLEQQFKGLAFLRK